jgi:hypothetical protein
VTRKSALQNVAPLHTAESNVEAFDAASFGLDAALAQASTRGAAAPATRGAPRAGPRAALRTAGSLR